MMRFTLTLLLLFFTLHLNLLREISCANVTATDNNDLHLANINATNDVSSPLITSASGNVEKKVQRDQRTLHRRAGGHLRGDLLNQSSLNIEDILRAKIESTTVKNYKTHFRRRAPPTKSQDKKKVINVSILSNSNESNEDENSLDYGLMTLSAAGEGNYRKKNESEDFEKVSFKDVGSKKDESKKTLSDQIAEGKYGLIEKEIFNKAPKAPGIISYKTNSETPNDNEKTLGGLSKDEIWLAEDHLLVLKGGISNEKKKNENENDWTPIDDYEAPKRPVKIPKHPAVPPPFPVQLTENGPLQFIGANQFSLFNPFTNETGLFANVDGHITPYDPSTSNRDHKKNSPTGLGAIKNTTKDKVHDVISPPPWLFHNSYKDVDLLKHFPFNLPLPDQALLNRTEDFDEDDPSLFYPPPYSFVYKTNYTNLAPVGPLVPGIILPPPPDFFSVYDPEEEKKPIKTPLDAYKRIKEIQLKNRLSATTTTNTPPPMKSSTSGYVRDFTRKSKLSSSIATTTKLMKIKTTLAPPITSTTIKPSTILYSTSPPNVLKFKTNHFETTTLKLHPVYVPTITTTTTPAPITPQISAAVVVPLKQYQKDYGTQAHPIYFEYFDARTTNPFIGPQYDYSSPSSTTSSPSPSSQSHKTSHKKSKQFYQPQFISSTISPANIDAKYLFVTTPTPPVGLYSTESYSNDYNTAIPVHQKPLVLKPVVNKFEDEIAAIKQTLDYYKQHSSVGGKKTKPPKVKAVYEFSFEASKHKNSNNNQENFKPMISTYSNAKKPDIKYSAHHIEELINTNSYFPTTTEPSVKYYRTKQAATLPPKKNYEDLVSAAPMMIYGQKLNLRAQQQQQQQQQSLNYYVRPIYKEVVTTPQQSKPQKIIVYPTPVPTSMGSNSNNGYRINSKNVKYRNQQQIYGHQASEVASLLNDTLVNYKQPQRPINPYSENIDLSQFPNQQRPPIQNSPPFFPQHQPSPYQPPYFHPPPPIIPPSYHSQRPLPPPQHYHQLQQQHHPSAEFTKFEYPHIPQINPASVHITFYNKPMEKSEENF